MQLKKSFNLWLTGLPSAGKTTTAEAIKERSKKEKINIVHLDGDSVRNGLNSDLGFSEADRAENLRRIIYMTQIIVNSDIPVVTSFISPFKESRDFARRIIPDFIEVYMSASLDICIKRDVKGLYAKALAGEIPNLTGIGNNPEARYDIPQNPELILDSISQSLESNIDKIFNYLSENNYIEL